jgi:uncharacterized protein (TIGR03067 family)
MRRSQCAAIVIVLAGSAFGQDAAKETKLLEGTWLPSAAELGGQPFDEATLKVMKLVLAGDKYTVTVGKSIDTGSVKLDLSKKPRAMDITGGEGPNKGKTFLAIYELNGDTLKVCYDLTGKARPSEFKTQKGMLQFLVTYQRGKS